jgi:hypothetical protein
VRALTRADCVRRLGLEPDASDDEIKARLNEEQRLHIRRLGGPTPGIRTEAQRRLDELQTIRKSLGFRPGETSRTILGRKKRPSRPGPKRPSPSPSPTPAEPNPSRPPTNDSERPSPSRRPSPRNTADLQSLGFLIVGVLILIVASVLLLRNWGVDDRIPPEAFIKQANGICQAGDTKLAEGGKAILKDPTATLDQWVRFYREHAVPNARYKIEEIGKLNPAKDRDKIQRMLAVGKKATDSVEAGLKNQGVAYLGASGPNPFKEFDATARKLKLTDCTSTAS